MLELRGGESVAIVGCQVRKLQNCSKTRVSVSILRYPHLNNGR
jgi:hypothetical protein